MSILSKVTVGLVSIMALVFWYMAMRTLKTHQAWRSAVAAHKVALAEVQTKTTAMREGNPEKGGMSLGSLQVSLDSAVFGRGRVWNEGAPRFDAARGTVAVAIDKPQPHQIEPNMLLHAFQGLDDAPGRYIGEFKVTAADANTVTLTPTYTPTAERQAVLQRSRGPWTLYEVLPTDMNELFAGLAEDDIRDMLPAPPKQLPGEVMDDFQARRLEHEALLREYLDDAKPIDANDPPPPERTQVVVKFVKDQKDLTDAMKQDLDRMKFGESLVKSGIVMKVDVETATELVRMGLVQEVERRYHRKLRDYGLVLREFHRRLPVTEDHIANLQKDLDYLVESNQDADKQLLETQMQDAALNQELALVTKELSVVSQFHSTLQQRLDQVNSQIALLQQENQSLAAQLSQRQLQAVGDPKATSQPASRSAGRAPNARGVTRAQPADSRR